MSHTIYESSSPEDLGQEDILKFFLSVSMGIGVLHITEFFEVFWKCISLKSVCWFQGEDFLSNCSWMDRKKDRQMPHGDRSQ